jgi:presequence protease
MTDNFGFELEREEEIPELNITARLYRHGQTGAELLSLINPEDENKVFGITFRTPPQDSTGLPHIMEHSVLGGSRKYPLKEPFVELVKGSLKTFLNALTFADMTTYPVASQNLQDFYNLVDVYLDSVFYPLITRQHLEQEGWHYELEHADAPLIYKGVVFNEMKGAYSSPDNLLYRYSWRALFPDTPYRYDSGGDPRVIPDLTYEQFKQFHQTYYHPSNASIFFYGDDDPEERLRLLDRYLRDFTAADVGSTIPLQKPLVTPRQERYTYGVDAGSDFSKKGMVTVNWLLAENNEPELTMALEILSYALMSTPASPLRKALIDSGLGEDVVGGGLSTMARQMLFSTGLKGIRVDDAARVEELVLSTLSRLADEGFEPDMVEAAVNSIEFTLRENNTGAYPRGLVLMIRALSTWLYDRDPLAALAFEAPLTAVKERLQQDPAYLQELIRDCFLQNEHRATVILEPDPQQRQREEAGEKERLAQVRAGLSAVELQALIDNSRELKLRQETPDPAEVLALVPRLTLDDLDKDVRTIPTAVVGGPDDRILYHDLFTNNIVYLDLGFNVHLLPAELLPYVPLFGRSLLGIGTEREDYVKLSQRIGRKTGGIAPATFHSAVQQQAEAVSWLFLRGKATVAQAADLLLILRDVLQTVKLDNRDRFRQMLLESKAGMEARLVPMGHAIVDTRLRGHFNEAGWLAEQMGGVSYLFFLRELATAVEGDWPTVYEKLESIRRHLLNRSAMLANVTLDRENWTAFQPQVEDFLAGFPATAARPARWSRARPSEHEGLTIPAQVNYVGKGANLYDLGYQLDGSVSVITNYLRTTWLWERIRVQGGAYGGFCSFDKQAGVFNYLSYRDPNLRATLDNYDQTPAFLRRLDISQDELTKSIIGAISALDPYELPDAKGYTALGRYLIGETDEHRQQYRDQVLSTDVADFKSFADVLAQVNDQGRVVVLGSQEAIEAANTDLDPRLEVTPVL